MAIYDRTAETQAESGPVDRFRDYLKRRNLRLTPERRVVLETMLRREGHFDAEELLQFVRRRNKAVSRATLYRTLEHLRGAGLVWMHRFGGGHAQYEHVYGRRHHDHMICDRCQRVIEFVNDDIEALQEEVCHDHDFTATRHVMQIFGICSECQQKDQRERS